MMSDSALYMFYLAWASTHQSQQKSFNDKSALHTYKNDDLVAMVSLVKLSEWYGPGAEATIKDPVWISTRLLEHERVIEDGFRRGPVLPSQFGALFSSLEKLDRFIEVNRHKIRDFLTEVLGQEQWGLDGLLDRPAARNWMSGNAAASLSGNDTAQWSDHLQARGAEADLEKVLRDQLWLTRSCEAVAQSLDTYVSRRRQRQIFGPTLRDDSRELVINLALLLPRDRRTDLKAYIAAINQDNSEKGLSFLLNGPWPPYSFCPSLELP